MNNYYKSEEFTFGKCETAYFELTPDMVCLRALYLVNGEVINTNLQVEVPNYFLPEGQFDTTIGLKQIEESEFQNVWRQSVIPDEQDWLRLKTLLHTGDPIEGAIFCFYPQGVILKLGLQFYGLADYDQCKSILGPDKMHPGNKIVLRVANLDDSNFWVVLK